MSITLTFPSHPFNKSYQISDQVVCTFSQETLADLFQDRVKNGMPHQIAIAKTTGGFSHVYDGWYLNAHVARGNLISPGANEAIAKISYFVRYPSDVSYKRVAKVKPQIDHPFWAQCAFSRATDFENPEAHYSIYNEIFRADFENDAEKGRFWRERLFAHIEHHFGHGMALLLHPFIHRSKFASELLENILQKGVSYEAIDKLLAGPPLGLEALLAELQSKATEPEAQFALWFVEGLQKGRVDYGDLQQISSPLAQACSSYALNDLSGLAAAVRQFPEWKKGHLAYLKCQALLSLAPRAGLDQPDLETLDNRVRELLDITREPYLTYAAHQAMLEIFAGRGISHSAFSVQQARALQLSYCPTSLSTLVDYAEVLFWDGGEEDKARACALLESSKLQDTRLRLYLFTFNLYQAIQKKDRSKFVQYFHEIYNIYQNHKALYSKAGSILLEEFFPFTPPEGYHKKVEEIVAGSRVEEVILARANYIFRTGTNQQVQAQLAQLPQSDRALPTRLRGELRLANSKKALDNLESAIKTLRGQSNPTANEHLLIALWYAHPCNREGDWTVLADPHFKLALANSAHEEHNFLRAELINYPRLSPEQQARLLRAIAHLLGH